MYIYVNPVIASLAPVCERIHDSVKCLPAFTEVFFISQECVTTISTPLRKVNEKWQELSLFENDLSGPIIVMKEIHAWNKNAMCSLTVPNPHHWIKDQPCQVSGVACFLRGLSVVLSPTRQFSLWIGTSSAGRWRPEKIQDRSACIVLGSTS